MIQVVEDEEEEEEELRLKVWSHKHSKSFRCLREGGEL